MKFEKGPLQDLLIIQPEIHQDKRGYFFETYNSQDFREIGIYSNFVQDNQSISYKNVIRGLHFQNTAPQAKLVRCVVGKVYDVVVDLRKTSPTYKQSFGIELSEDNMMMMLVPKGFAHGFVCLSKKCTINYKCSEYRDANSERTLLWNDEKININWPIKNPILSKKDKKGLGLIFFKQIDN